MDILLPQSKEAEPRRACRANRTSFRGDNESPVHTGKCSSSANKPFLGMWHSNITGIVRASQSLCKLKVLVHHE